MLYLYSTTMQWPLPKIEQKNCSHYESMKASPDFTWSVVLHIFWESQATSPWNKDLGTRPTRQRWFAYLLGVALGVDLRFPWGVTVPLRCNTIHGSEILFNSWQSVNLTICLVHHLIVANSTSCAISLTSSSCEAWSSSSFQVSESQQTFGKFMAWTKWKKNRYANHIIEKHAVFQ